MLKHKLSSLTVVAAAAFFLAGCTDKCPKECCKNPDPPPIVVPPVPEVAQPPQIHAEGAVNDYIIAASREAKSTIERTDVRKPTGVLSVSSIPVGASVVVFDVSDYLRSQVDAAPADIKTSVRNISLLAETFEKELFVRMMSVRSSAAYHAHLKERTAGTQGAFALAELIKVAREEKHPLDYIMYIERGGVLLKTGGKPIATRGKENMIKALKENPGLGIGDTRNVSLITGDYRAPFIPDPLIPPMLVASIGAKLINVKTGAIEWIGEFDVRELATTDGSDKIIVNVVRSVVFDMEQVKELLKKRYDDVRTAAENLHAAINDASKEYSSGKYKMYEYRRRTDILKVRKDSHDNAIREYEKAISAIKYLVPDLGEDAAQQLNSEKVAAEKKDVENGATDKKDDKKKGVKLYQYTVTFPNLIAIATIQEEKAVSQLCAKTIHELAETLNIK